MKFEYEKANDVIISLKKNFTVLATVAIAVFCLYMIMLLFPTVEYKGKKIRIFTMDQIGEKIEWNSRKGQSGPIDGNVLGSHILETEYGSIALKNLCHISVRRDSFYAVYDENFKKGRATHNLVVEGIKIPDVVFVRFNKQNQINLLDLNGQEITVSGIPFNVGKIYFMFDIDPVEIETRVRCGLEYIALADSTKIYNISQSRFLGHLSIYPVEERWVLTDTFEYISVQLPGETEFKKYRSITFKKDWGEFIEGELLDDATQ